MMKRIVSAALFALLLFFAPLTAVFAAEQQTPETSSLMEGPFVIVAFATIILMVYYAFRD
ncbi:hypothetical protein [Evansella clarkii]|uniref:hypothetical protein n=1 Tax=Evansella clarkii TaxID=79879 RepID=UPI0009965D62|nr:hypothetical protein [Evansella clarkii]